MQSASNNPETTDAMRRAMTNPSAGWLSLMADAYTIRSGLIFSKRRRFDEALRPVTDNGNVIGYPDAIYHITPADLDRAKAAIEGQTDR